MADGEPMGEPGEKGGGGRAEAGREDHEEW
jgi:hypothetical protein